MTEIEKRLSDIEIKVAVLTERIEHYTKERWPPTKVTKVIVGSGGIGIIIAAIADLLGLWIR